MHVKNRSYEVSHVIMLVHVYHGEKKLINLSFVNALQEQWNPSYYMHLKTDFVVIPSLSIHILDILQRIIMSQLKAF